MENLIFFAAPEGKFVSEAEMTNRVSSEFASFGTFPLRTVVGKAVYPKAPEGGESGLVAFFKTKEIYSLPAFKPRLCPGTYGPALDEVCTENFTFRAMVDYNPENTFEQVVNTWQKEARRLFDREKVWVSALFFKRDTNIYIAGNTHPELAKDVLTWMGAVKKLVQNINVLGEIFIMRPIFYDMERAFNG